MAIDSIGTRRAPVRNENLIGQALIERLTPATVTVGSSGVSLTAAQLLKKLIPLNSTDAGTLTLPTATEIVDAVNGLGVGDVLEFQFVNYGDSTCTIAVGTGITNKVIDSESAILTIATHIAQRFALVCTGIAQPSNPATSNTFDLYGFGPTTATA